MRFWDSSGLVSLFVDEPQTESARALIDDDDEMAAWWASPVECWSAFARLRREGVLSISDEQAARDRVQTLRTVWLEIQPTDQVRLHAGRLLRVHAVRAADALQLAAAIVWAGSPPAGEIVTFDERLREAARLEELTPVP